MMQGPKFKGKNLKKPYPKERDKKENSNFDVSKTKTEIENLKKKIQKKLEQSENAQKKAAAILSKIFK